MRAIALFGAGLALFVAGQTAGANPFERTLGNGLKVVVKEDRRAPTAVQMVWYRAGSIDEFDGTSGVAHLLEHMMFKGTPSVGPGEFNRRVATAGGRDNAFTAQDYTAYFQQVPKESLDEVMQLEADRMRHLTLDNKEYLPEMKVVMEERRMRTDDEPTAMLHEQLMAAAFIANPYRRPVIGWMNDLEAMTVQDARDWYERWYVPNNATLVIVGDVDHETAFRLAEKHYGPLQPRALPERKPRLEPVQVGIRRITVKAPADLPHLVMAYKAPMLHEVASDRTPYALEMLAAILDGNDAARFPSNLVKAKRLAVSASVAYDNVGRGPGLFMLSGEPSEGRTVEELEAGLRAEIESIKKDGVSAEELARARAQVVSGQIYKLDSVMGQAMEIGLLEAVGYSWRDVDRMIAGLKAVTATEVQDAAKAVFDDDRLTVAVLDPQPVADAPRRRGPSGSRPH